VLAGHSDPIDHAKSIARQVWRIWNEIGVVDPSTAFDT
jgi:hypothetical protein